MRPEPGGQWNDDGSITVEGEGGSMPVDPVPAEAAGQIPGQLAMNVPDVTCWEAGPAVERTLEAVRIAMGIEGVGAVTADAVIREARATLADFGERGKRGGESDFTD